MATAAQALWDETEIKSPAGDGTQTKKERVPDGKYAAKITSWAVIEGKYGPQLEVGVTYPKFLMSKDYWDGEKIWYPIPDPQDENANRAQVQTRKIKKLMNDLKIPVSGFAALSDAATAKKAIGLEVEVKKETNGKYTNHYFNLIGNGRSTGPASVTTEDDLPF